MDFFKYLKNRKGASGAIIGTVAVLALAFMVASVSYMIPVSAQVQNPELSGSCGIDIALILDNSGSINSTELAAVKSAAKDFVDAFLPLTPTNIAVVKFATNGYLVLDYNNDATTIKNAIDSITTTSGTASYTNWDMGLKRAQEQFDNSAKPDLYVFISDGNPNRWSESPVLGSGSALNPLALAAAVTRADAIKTAGVRIITLGIGNDLNATSLGELSYPDPAIVSDFNTLADDLADLANELCGGTVIVRKYVDSVPTSGWHFDITGASSTSNPANGDTDVDGYVIFDVDVETSVNVDLTETLQGGYSFDSASCDDGQSASGVNSVTNILVQKNGIVNCVFNNVPCVCTSGECCDGCNYRSSDYQCRGSTGACDVAETCTGDSADCPADEVRPNGYVCDVDTGVCEADDTCDGQTKVCNENYAPEGTDCGVCAACDDSGSCTYDETQDDDCSDTLCPDSCNIVPDSNPFTWDYANDVPNECTGLGTCSSNACTYNHACADADNTDGVFNYGGIQTCTAECDGAGIECQSECQGLTWKHDGTCSESCLCNYVDTDCADLISCTVDSCDAEEGCLNTPDDSLCDDSNVCTLDVCDVEGCTHTPIDSTDPETTKTLYPANGKSINCFDDEEDVLPEEVVLTNGCKYVKAGTTVVLESHDDLSNSVDVHWVVKYKVNPEDSWVIDQQGVDTVGESEGDKENVTITLNKDSYHLIEYWAVDECGNEEDHHYELDIVDSQGPLAVKTVGEPKDEWHPGVNGDPVSYFYPEETANCWAEEGGIDCWQVTTLTPILMDCEDPEPHPVGEKKICFNVDVDGEDKTKEYCREYGGLYHKSDEYMEDSVCCRWLGPEDKDFKMDGWERFPCKDKCDETQDIECYNNRKLLYFTEETEHNLKYYCIDKLWNKGDIDEEKFKVEGNRFEVPLFKKWNLISVPFTLLNDDPETIFSKIYFDGQPIEDIENYIDSVWAYDPEHTMCGNDWCVWSPDAETPDNLKIWPGWGYWVLVTDKPDDNDCGWLKCFKHSNNEEPLWMILGGSLFSPAQTPPSKSLVKGWNLIGYYGVNWEEYDEGDLNFMCGDQYGGWWTMDDKKIYGDKVYCALNSLVDTQAGYPRWSSLWSYINCGNHNTDWLGLNACYSPSPFVAQDRMYAGRGYWIEIDVPDIYAPATNCIWNSEFVCKLTGGGLLI